MEKGMPESGNKNSILILRSSQTGITVLSLILTPVWLISTTSPSRFVDSDGVLRKILAFSPCGLNLGCCLLSASSIALYLNSINKIYYRHFADNNKFEVATRPVSRIRLFGRYAVINCAYGPGNGIVRCRSSRVFSL